MRKLFSYHTTSESEHIVNLTPLIDVVFVVLVAFIIIAPMLQIDLVDLADGSNGQMNALQSTSKVQIIVNKDNTVLLNSKKININELETLLKAERNNYPTESVQLFHDRSASFGTYQTIKNAVEASGFEEIQVVLQ